MKLHHALFCLFASAFVVAPTFAAVTVLPGGDNQVARVGAGFPNPIRIAVTDDVSGKPVPGAYVGISLPWQWSGGAAPVVCCFVNDLGYTLDAVADENGIAIPLLFGLVPGQSTFRVWAFSNARNHGTTTLTVNVSNEPPPARLVNVSPTAPLPGGETVRDAFRVQALDSAGNPVPYAVVDLSVGRTASNGTFLVHGALEPGVHVLPHVSRYVADDRGILSAAFTPAVPKPTAREAAAGKVGGGTVQASIRGPETPAVEMAIVGSGNPVWIPYTVKPPAAGIPTTTHDLWWGGPAENGWGLSIIEHSATEPDGLPKLFVVLFIYNASGEPVWYVIPDGRWAYGYGSTWSGEIYRPQGAPFHAYDAGKHVLGKAAGVLELKFFGASSIEMTTGFFRTSPEEGSTAKRLTRLDFSGSAPSPRAGIADLWWGGPSQNGWGIAIHENLGNVFSVWFTYNDGNQPVWLVMPNGAWTDANTFAGPIFKPTGPKWIGTPYDASKHRIDALGEFSLRFGAGTPAGQAALQYRVGPYTGTLNISPLPF